MTERVMVDLETLGLHTGAAILSIGACRFEPGDGVSGDTFYIEIDTDSCIDHGLTVEEETLEWWQQKDDDLAPLHGEATLPDALTEFNEWLDAGLDEIWANSPSFDCEQLEAAYAAVDMEPPWQFYHERDVRTVRSLPGAVEVAQDGREHHALDDARHQAREVARTLAVLGGDA